MTKASKKPTSKRTTPKKAALKKSASKKLIAKKPAGKAVKKPATRKAMRLPRPKPTSEGEHVKVAQIVMPTGRIRKRAVWGVKDQDGRRVGEVAIRGKRFLVEQAGNQWKVVKELAAAVA